MSEDDNVIPWRPFKFPKHKLIDSDFIPSRLEENRQFMEADLEASGLTPKDLDAYVHGKFAVPANFVGGYCIPYTYPHIDQFIINEQQELVMYRLKLDPLPGYVPERKYDQPTRAELEMYGLEGSLPYIPRVYHMFDSTDTLYICEGEKKTVSLSMHIHVPAIGIGGCWSWRDGTPEGGVHPWILQLAKKYSKVVIVPDGDYRRYNISKAYGTLVSEMQMALPDWEGTVHILDCPGKIDDLIVKWGPEAEYNFEQLELLDALELVEIPATLVKKYHLSYTETKNGGVKVKPNTHTIQTLIDRHPAFQKPWLNTDNQRVYMGEDEYIPGHTNIEIANHFQYNFQMLETNPKAVDDVVRSISIRDERSPFLDFIEAQVWDQQPRLDTWLTEYWGVEDNDYTREIASKFLISSVARLKRPGCKVDWMLITTGAQGVGKSSMPDIFWPGLSKAITGGHGDKDTLQAIHSALVLIIDELDAFTKADQTRWKTLITSPEDMFRAPYSAAMITYRRRSVFYGTTNATRFIEEDATGYRRYKPIEVNQLLDFQGLREVMPQLWAEAAHRFRNGESWHATLMPPDIDKMIVRDSVREIIEHTVDQRIRAHVLRPDSARVEDGHFGTVRGRVMFCFTKTQMLQWLEQSAFINTPLSRKVDNILGGLAGAKQASNPPKEVTAVPKGSNCWRIDVQVWMESREKGPTDLDN